MNTPRVTEPLDVSDRLHGSRRSRMLPYPRSGLLGNLCAIKLCFHSYPVGLSRFYTPLPLVKSFRNSSALNSSAQPLSWPSLPTSSFCLLITYVQPVNIYIVLVLVVLAVPSAISVHKCTYSYYLLPVGSLLSTSSYHLHAVSRMS